MLGVVWRRLRVRATCGLAHYLIVAPSLHGRGTQEVRHPHSAALLCRRGREAACQDVCPPNLSDNRLPFLRATKNKSQTKYYNHQRIPECGPRW
jgi:hypothetical protein